VNVASLPGVVEAVFGMPDMHEGYGFPIGGVAAMRPADGVVSPGGVGFDINCGVRLLATPLVRRDVADRIAALVHEISRSIPSGIARGGAWALSDDEMDRVLGEGAHYVVHAKRMGLPADLEHTESGGVLTDAGPSRVSVRARDRGRDQLGTLGSGNHFIEVQQIDEIYVPEIADALGLVQGGLTVLIHTGSRGLGHQVCTDYVGQMKHALERSHAFLPDPQLAYAPIDSPSGRDYLAAMAGAANFAFANRQVIAHRVRHVIETLFRGIDPARVRTVFDVAHNIAKMELHDGERLCVHRKGATRAFGPGHAELPEDYQSIGQPVFIPGSMGTASFVMTGLASSERLSFGSACHGAGRSLSRTAARRRISGIEMRRQLEAQGIVVRCPSANGLSEEAPFAYKDVERVAAVVEEAGLARRIARLTPLGVVKG
jgi:tRNA-splicing ligase RtcB